MTTTTTLNVLNDDLTTQLSAELITSTNPNATVREFANAHFHDLLPWNGLYSELCIALDIDEAFADTFESEVENTLDSLKQSAPMLVRLARGIQSQNRIAAAQNAIAVV